jgi:hypothetical protein
MEIWSESELQRHEEVQLELGGTEKLQVLQHAYSERFRELLHLKDREEKLVLWLTALFAFSILGSLVFNSVTIYWIAKLFFAAILALTGWYGSEYISQGRDEMQTIIALLHEIREEISAQSYGYSRELLPDPSSWDVASRWELGPIDLFLKGSALTAIVTLLFA